MRKISIALAAILVAGSAGLALAQGPKPGDANPPGALKQGGIPPAAAMRRGDDMSMPNQPMGMRSKKSMRMSMAKKKKMHHSM